MDRPIPPDVARAVRRLRVEMLQAEIKGGAWFVVPLTALLVFLAYLAISPVRAVGTTEGVARGVHAVQADDGRGPLVIFVELTEGRTVRVSLPKATGFRNGARVELSVREHSWPPKRTSYRFSRYLDLEEGEAR